MFLFFSLFCLFQVNLIVEIIKDNIKALCMHTFSIKKTLFSPNKRSLMFIFLVSKKTKTKDFNRNEIMTYVLEILLFSFEEIYKVAIIRSVWALSHQQSHFFHSEKNISKFRQKIISKSRKNWDFDSKKQLKMRLEFKLICSYQNTFKNIYKSGSGDVVCLIWVNLVA